MGQHLDARRRMILSRGRPMTLRRLVPAAAPVSVSLTGFARLYRPGELEGPIQQGDQQVEILNDEIAAAGFPAPATGMLLIVDGNQTKVQGSRPVYEAGTLIGHSVWTRG